MKILLLCAFVASAFASKPSFTWLHDRTSEFNVPLLEIKFPDGGEKDYAILEPYNPIPKRAYERAEDVDKCIFQGKLKNEPDVHVTVTGGCPRDEMFEIQFRSKRLNDHLFKMVNGNVEVLESPLSQKELEFMVQDIARDTERNFKRLEGTDRVPLPPSLVMNVGAHYEQTFKARFGSQSVNTMRRVLAQSQNIYYWPSLTTRIRLNVVFERELNMTLEASGVNLTSIFNIATDPNINTNVVFCSQNDQYGVVGIAWLATVCDTILGYRTNINEYFFTDSQTAQIVSHEIGHNLGMYHDFTSTGAPRNDSQGRTCKNIGGIMDYNQQVFSVWSTCSVEDFTSYYNSFPSFCMPQDNNGPSTPPTPPTSTTTTTNVPTTGWSDWTDYTTCSTTCGAGQIVRWRQCNGGLGSCPGCNAAYFPCSSTPCSSSNITVLTFELQDVFSRSFLGGTLSINGQNYAVPAIFNNVRNGTTFNVGASAPGYWVVPPKPVTAMAVGSAPIGAPLQYLTSIIPVPTTAQRSWIAAVLSWGPGVVDLDLYVAQFLKSAPSVNCRLYYGNRACNGSSYPTDWTSSGSYGGEVALLGNTTAFADFGYAVYVRAANFPQSQASVEIYYGFPRDPILATPSFTGPEPFWAVGCISGATGNVTLINTAYSLDPFNNLITFCSSRV